MFPSIRQGAASAILHAIFHRFGHCSSIVLPFVWSSAMPLSRPTQAILGGCALLEEFSGAPGTQLDGRSVSTFDRATGKWKQTWVDNTASYLDFTGGLVEGRMVLEREATLSSGQHFQQRMVYQDIRPDSLRWLWQRSDDGGKTWSTNWEIEYKRLR